MNMYEVTLIIPVYNVANYIRDSLLSALAQTFESIEYIVVDDCGTDDSLEIVKSILSSHQRAKDVFIYRHNCNKGLSAARNTGLEKAHGKFVYFIDSDDEITKGVPVKKYATRKQRSAIKLIFRRILSTLFFFIYFSIIKNKEDINIKI